MDRKGGSKERQDGYDDSGEGRGEDRASGGWTEMWDAEALASVMRPRERRDTSGQERESDR
jgi:hypothetical protein